MFDEVCQKTKYIRTKNKVNMGYTIMHDQSVLDVCFIYFKSPTLTPYFQFLSFITIQTIDHFKLDFCRDILSIVVRSDMWQTSEENRKIFIEGLGIKWID